jgi:hypothetical protein
LGNYIRLILDNVAGLRVEHRGHVSEESQGVLDLLESAKAARDSIENDCILLSSAGDDTGKSFHQQNIRVHLVDLYKSIELTRQTLRSVHRYLYAGITSNLQQLTANYVAPEDGASG